MSTEAAETKQTPSIPPVGAPCWIEIMSVDPAKLKEFYASLFPAWNWKDPVQDGRVIQYDFKQPSGISGGIVKLPEDCVRPSEQPMGSGTTVYYFVESIEKIERDIAELSGTLCLPKTAEGKNGWFANFRDPEGNRFGVYEANWG
ncbi:hypothetical protein BDV96DRAFT_647436 [Lophiotrema nucula]|uniref:VOC domain-containing protein n=1 Tax=Lophiotrema nucula TaxID=690887 RepID=A0A6A5Z4L1_9PLEO|nr:hypothetical protein BDV96DRAFT_647436 [Lophiotrema nucula]